MNRVRAKLHADAVYDRGITGKGVNVAVLDTGESVPLRSDTDLRILSK